jgi:calcineurin-like phosphoesterase family protein
MFNIIETPESKVWFTSDWHYNHDRDFLWAKRGYASVQAHNVDLIRSINALVGPDDIIFNLGDLTLNCTLEQFEALIAQIVCRNIYLMAGNHPNPHFKSIYKPMVQKLLGDAYTPESEVYPLRYKNIVYINQEQEITVNRQKIVLSHYPHIVWNHSSKGAWMLCGHSHSDCEMTNSRNTFGKILDVGFDEFKRPLSFNEIRVIMDKKPTQKVDHHQ